MCEQKLLPEDAVVEPCDIAKLSAVLPPGDTANLMVVRGEEARHGSKSPPGDQDFDSDDAYPYKYYRRVRGANGQTRYVYSCFSGEAGVYLADGQVKPAKDIQVGDKLATPEGCTEVQARTIQAVGCAKELVCIGDALLISPSHRIMWEGRWVKPIQAEGAHLMIADIELYNFVTAPIGDPILVEGIVTSTLGTFCEGTHRMSKPTHRLWNTPKIVKLLQRHVAWPNVVFESDDAALHMLKDAAFAERYLADLEGQASVAHLRFDQVISWGRT